MNLHLERTRDHGLEDLLITLTRLRLPVILAFIIIIAGGITIMTAGGNEDSLKKGKNIIKNGLIGAAIVLCSGFILSLLLEFLYPLFYPIPM